MHFDGQVRERRRAANQPTIKSDLTRLGGDEREHATTSSWAHFPHVEVEDAHVVDAFEDGTNTIFVGLG
mgnify:CR=1 FL=1